MAGRGLRFTSTARQALMWRALFHGSKRFLDQSPDHGDKAEERNSVTFRVSFAACLMLFTLITASVEG